MDGVVNISEDPVNASEHRVKVTWVGLEDEEPTSEPMSVIYADAPKTLRWMLCIGASRLHLGVPPLPLRRTPYTLVYSPFALGGTLPPLHCVPTLALRRTLLSLHCGLPSSCTAMHFCLLLPCEGVKVRGS